MIGMALSDRLSGANPSSLWKKTILYVLSFGFGALFLAGTLGFVMTSVAGAILPGDKPTAQASPESGASTGSRPPKATGASKAKPPRGNEGAEAAK